MRRAIAFNRLRASGSRLQAVLRGPGLRHAARVTLTVLLTSVAFVTATAAGVVIHLNHPASRRLVTSSVNRLLAPVLNGTITLDGVERISLLSGRVDRMDVTIRDPEDHVVIVARGVSARISLPPLLRSLVTSGPLIVALNRVHISAADVTMRDDASGVSSLADTFSPRATAPSGSPSVAGPPGPGVVLTIAELTIGHAWAHGSTGSLPVDADVDALSAQLRVDSELLSSNLHSLAFRLRSLPIPAGSASGSVDGVVALALAPQLRLAARAHVQVLAGELPATAWASIDGEAIEARVEVPNVPAHALSSVIAELPIISPVCATLEASGTVDGVRATGRIDVGHGHVDLSGGVKWDAGLTADLGAKVVQLSLSETVEGAPAGIVDADVVAGIEVLPRGALRATYDVRSAATSIAGQPVPAIATQGAFDGSRLTGKATILEPGARLSAAYELSAEPGKPGILGLDVDARTEIPELRSATRLGGALGGAAKAHARGHLTLDKGLALNAVVNASGSRLRTGSVAISQASVAASVQGSARSPAVHATVRASELRAAGVAVTRVVMDIQGEVLAPQVRVSAETSDGDTLDASASVALGTTTTLRSVDAHLVRNREKVDLVVGSVRLSGTGAAIEGLSMRGAAGSLRADVRAEHGTLRAKVESTELDLGRLSALVGKQAPAPTGTASINAALVATPVGTSGYVRIAARDLGVAQVRGTRIDAEALFDGRAVALRAAASAADLGSIVVVSDHARLGGSMLALSSYRTMTGAWSATIVADLARLAALLPEGTLPLERVSGKAIATVHARRDQASMPDVTVDVSTAGLELEGRTDHGIAGARLHAVELTLSGRHEALTGQISIDAFANDALGEIAELHASAKPALNALLSSPATLRQELLSTAFEFEAKIPRRDLQRFPDAVPSKLFHGDAAATLTASGTARNPRATLAIRASHVSLGEPGPRNTPLDVRLDATFADGQGSSSAEIASKGRALMVARGDGSLQVADLIDGRVDGPRWSAGGDLVLSALPLRSLPLLVGQPIGGCVSGTVALRGLHDDAMVDADLRIDGLRVGQVSFREATLKGHAGAGMATLDARLAQDAGLLTAKGSVGIKWGTAVVPTLDITRESEGRVRAQAFRLSPLQPFVRDALGRVDGLLDADVTYRLLPSNRAGGRFEGEASVREGVVDAAILGQELRAIEGKVSLSRNGELRLYNASARGISGRVVIDGTAHLDGFALRDAKATVRIARREMMSLTYEGVELGSAWGDIDLTATQEANGVISVGVWVPKFTLELPDAEARTTQKLEDEPTVQIGTRTDRRFVSLLRGPPPKKVSEPSAGAALPSPAQTTSVVVRVNLGKQVRVYHTNLIEAWLSGNVQAVIKSGNAALSGSVLVDHGFLEIQGRRFTIEHATATFDPARAPGDPMVMATAVYEAPDATRIFADFEGTAEKGKLRLHSEPALTQTEILSLIVFGTRESAGTPRGNGAAGSSGAAGTAATVGGGVATQGLNKALANITPVEVTTRVDTSNTQDPRPEVAVAISSKVSASVWYRLGQPLPGQNPDRSMLRLDYRFYPRWSLQTSVGDKGTSIVDVFWKLRY
ncbi:MAG: translocation/assembly module TamB domain-containing protein [Deltaproteobacteria bacterium]|nr:translocation/assembly module TamB domain-containing protein [Deltaproteobacteria bacterium]